MSFPRINLVGAFASLGITSTILWCKLMGHTSAFYIPLSGLGTWANARIFWLIGILACAILCCLLPRTARRIDMAQRYVMPLIAVAGGISFALAFHQTYFDQRMLAAVGITVSGFGYFWFISRFVLLLGVTQGVSCLAWSFASAFILRYVLLVAMDAVIPTSWQVMVAIALPLVSVAMFEAACVAARRGASESGPAASERTLWGIPTLPKPDDVDADDRRYLVVSVLAIGVLLSIVRACGISGLWGGDHTAGITFWSALLTILVMFVIIRMFVAVAIVGMKSQPVTMRFQIGILIVIAWLLAAVVRTYFPDEQMKLLDILISTNDPIALVFFWSAVAMAVDALYVPANRVIGIAGSVYAFASIIWVGIIDRMNAVNGVFVLTMVYVLFAVFMLATWMVRRRRDDKGVSLEGRVAGSNSSLAAPEPHAGQINSAQSDDSDSGSMLAQALMARCDEVARECLLTPREKDVLVLLAQGKTGSVIQEELVIAASTVKTHTQHIYAKVGVDDRQQLMDLLLGKH